MDKTSSTPNDPGSANQSGWSGAFLALRYPDFRILWINAMCIQGGAWLMQVTLGWLAFEMTRSPLQVGLIVGLRSAPLLLAPLTGVLADRFDRRRLLIVDQAFVTALILGFAVVLLLDLHEVWHLYVFSGLFGLAWSINNPVRQTLVATSVPRETLVNAFALIAIASNSVRTLGPALGGVLILFFGAGFNFLLMGLLFLVVLLLLIPFRVRYGSSDQSVARSQSPLRNLLDGFRYVRGEPLTMTTMAVTFSASLMLMGPIHTQMAVYTAEVLDDEEGLLLGLLTASLGIGGLIGTVLMARFAYTPRKGRMASYAFAASAICLLGLSEAAVFWLAAVLLILMQGAFQAIMTLNQTIVQTVTPDAMRGRVTGVYQMEIGMTTIGGITAGAIASLLGVQPAFAMGALAALGILALVTVFAPRYRRLEL